MKENEEHIIYKQILKSYLDDHLHSQVKNITQEYLNDNLEMCVESVVRKLHIENSSRLIRWFFDEHSGFCIFVGSVILTGVACLIVIGCGLLIHNLEMDKLRQEAQVCIETGYGCKSSNQNTDIQYHDTPIIDIKNDN